MNKTAAQVEQELIEQIEKCRFIYEGLKDNGAYIALVDDFKKAIEDIDSVWHLEKDINRLSELRITKLAGITLVNALEEYKSVMQKSKERLETLRNEE
jgi:hypothetical protein